MLIAIDGPAASGKGTIAKQIAANYNLKYLDTGRLYRAVGFLLENSMEGRDITTLSYDELQVKAEEIAKNLDLNILNNPEILNEEIGKIASIVSAIPQVRDALMDVQKMVASDESGSVLDGRDIGTVICPDADFKFFITASAEIRAKRRFLQLQASKKDVKEADVLQDILSRDERDSNRIVAPLAPATDAIFLDTTEMSIDDVFKNVKNVIDSSI